MIFTTAFFQKDLWFGSTNRESFSITNEIYISSSFEYAICNSMIEPGKKAGIINKVSFKNKVNIFSASSNEDLEIIQNYINNNDEKEFWSSFDFSRLVNEDWIDVFTDKESKDFHEGVLVKEKFIGIIKKCHFDGFVFRDGGEILSISPALKRQEVIGLFDSSLLLLEDYLCGSDILKSKEFKSLREKEWEKFTQIYEAKGKNQPAEKFLKKMKEKPVYENRQISVILTETELLGSFNRYGLKILSYQAGSIESKNRGIRQYYDYTKALFANSLFSDFLKVNGLETYRREWIESKKEYKWKQDSNGNWTRDIICIKFDYGVRTYKAEEKSITDKKNKADEDFKIFEIEKKKELEVLSKNETVSEKEKKYTEERIKNEIQEAEDDKKEKITFYDGLLQFAKKNQDKYPSSREIIRKDKKTGKESNATSDIAITAGQLRVNFYTAEDGIKIEYEDGEEIYYKPLYRTVGKAKQGAVYFCRYDKDVPSNERFYDKARNFLRMGKEFPDEKNRIVEIGAYQSLISSNISGKIKINPSNILVIEDEDSYFESDIIRVFSEGSKDLKLGKAEYKKENLDKELKKKLKNTLWDGQSLIDKSVFDKAYFFRPEEEPNGWILCRQHFFKSACFCSDLKQFFLDYCKSHGKDYETFTVKDIWGKKHLVKDIELITTENSLKWMKFSKNSDGTYDYQGFKDWKKLVNNQNQIFGIVKTAHKSRYGDYQRLSFQMLNCLDINKIDKITEDSIKYLAELKESTDEYVNDLSKDIENCEFIKFLDLHKTNYNDYEVLIELCKQDRTFFQSEYFRDRRKQIIYDYTKELKSGRILLKNSDNLTLVGNPYAMLLKAVKENPLDDPTFKKGPREDGAIECFSSFFNEDTPVSGFRSPFNSRNNLLYMYNIKKPDEFKYFIDHDGKSLFGKQVLIINCNQTCAQPRANGMDFDSDFAYCTAQEDICNLAKEYAQSYPTIINDIELKRIEPEDQAKIDHIPLMELYAQKDDMLAGAREQIGEASNKALLALSYLSSIESDQKVIQSNINDLDSMAENKSCDYIETYLEKKEKWFPGLRQIREQKVDASLKACSAKTYFESIKKDKEDKQCKLKIDICVLSVLAQAAIDSAKREYDVDIENSIDTISDHLNISENQYPKFWKIVDDRAKVSTKGIDEESSSSEDQISEEENKSQNKKKNKKRKGKIYRDRSILDCPMNIVFEKDYNSECNKILKANKEKGKRSNLKTLDMEDFFKEDLKSKPQSDCQKLLQQGLKESKKEVPPEARRIEELVKKFSLSLSENAKEKNNDDEYDLYLLLKSDFRYLKKEIKTLIKENKTQERFSEFIFSWLIDRAFLISVRSRAHSNQIEAVTKKNKSLLLKVLYDVDKDALLKCFSKKIE